MTIIMFHAIKPIRKENGVFGAENSTNFLDVEVGDVFFLPSSPAESNACIQLLADRKPKEISTTDEVIEISDRCRVPKWVKLDYIAKGECPNIENCKCRTVLDEICVQPSDSNPAEGCIKDFVKSKDENNGALADEILKLQAENQKLKNTISQSHTKLQLLRAENLKLQERSRKEYNDINQSLYTILQQYCEVGHCFEESKHEIKDLEEQLKKEKAEVNYWKREAVLLKEQLQLGAVTPDPDDQSVDEIDECSLPEDDKLGVNDTQLTPLSASPSNTDISLSCTLCTQKLRLEDLERHSKVCSAGISSQPATPSLPGMLVANVTRSSIDSQQENSFKVVTKTTLNSYTGSFFQVQRAKEDFQWIWNTLQATCPELIVPPLDLPDHLHGMLREMQRFLRRVCSHRIMKENVYLKSFLTGTTKEFEKTKKSFKRKRLPHRQTSYRKPSKEGKSEDGLLMRSQKYFSELQANLTELRTKFQDSFTSNWNATEVSKCFKCLGQGEINDTFLKMASQALSKVSQTADLDATESDAAVLIENLSSLINYTNCAQKLLDHVGGVIDTFLYWEEEMEVYEEMEKQGSITASNGVIVTKKWAEASAKCNEVKNELEQICDGLSDELFWFDFQKEQELKEIFTEYAEGRSEQFEKLKSKWYSLKLILETDIDLETRGIQFHSPRPPSN